MKGNRSLLLLFFVFIVAGLVALFFAYYGNGGGKKQTSQETEVPVKKPGEDEGVSSTAIKTEEMQEGSDEDSGDKVQELQALSVEEECTKIEDNMLDFFNYLDEKEYIKKQGLEGATLSKFEDILNELSLHMPVPAGEGLNYDTIIRNIYHFYRALDLQDLIFIKSVLRNEAEAMEVNMSMFYKWLMSGDRCGQGKVERPSFSTIYGYAGYLMNSIGGRAYLFRRNTTIRLLIHYYCLLIIREADKRKMNTYGIDVLPFIEPLAREIENYPLLYFHKEYASNLLEIRDYYLKKRKGS